MEVFNTVVSLIRGLAWPVVIVWVVLVFRKEIKGILATRNARLKAGPFEVALEQARVEVEAATQVARLDSPEDAGQLPQPTPPHASASDGFIVVDPRLAALARTDPTAALLQGFGQLEAHLRGLLVEHRDADSVQMGLIGGIRLATSARTAELITAESYDAIQGLAVLRNLAAHGMETVDTEKALDFLRLLDGALYSLRRGPGGRLHRS